MTKVECHTTHRIQDFRDTCFGQVERMESYSRHKGSCECQELHNLNMFQCNPISNDFSNLPLQFCKSTSQTRTKQRAALHLVSLGSIEHFCLRKLDLLMQLCALYSVRNTAFKAILWNPQKWSQDDLSGIFTCKLQSPTLMPV